MFDAVLFRLGPYVLMKMIKWPLREEGEVYRTDKFVVLVAHEIEIDIRSKAFYLPGSDDQHYEKPILTKTCGVEKLVDEWIEQYKIAYRALNGCDARIVDLNTMDELPMETVG